MCRLKIYWVLFIRNLPMIGTVSDVAGTFSATISMKTENATKQVKPRVTFSPEDVGNL